MDTYCPVTIKRLYSQTNLAVWLCGGSQSEGPVPPRGLCGDFKNSIIKLGVACAVACSYPTVCLLELYSVVP